MNNRVAKFEIIKSIQKDKLYRAKLRLATEQLIKSVFKNANIFRLGSDLRFISDLIYYSCTTLANKQTMGQEYYNLILFNRNTQKLPQFIDRLFFILIKLVLPYLNVKLLKLYDRNVKKKILFNLLQFILFYVKKINLIKFYFDNSSFASFENRCTNISLISINPNINSSKNNIYLALGFLELLTFILNLLNEFKDLYKVRKNLHIDFEDNSLIKKNEIINSLSNCKSKCPLCLEFIINPTLTYCGHIFCWNCVNKYVSCSLERYESAKCPTCRVVIEKNKLIYMFNYK